MRKRGKRNDYPLVLFLLQIIGFIPPPHQGQALSQAPTSKKGKGEMISSCVLLGEFCPRATTLLAKKKKKEILCPAKAGSSTLHPLLLIQPTWIWDFFEVFSVVG